MSAPEVIESIRKLPPQELEQVLVFLEKERDALEERYDQECVRSARAEGGAPIPYEVIRREAGLE